MRQRTTILDIIEAGLRGDQARVRVYTELLIQRIEEEAEARDQLSVSATLSPCAAYGRLETIVDELGSELQYQHKRLDEGVKKYSE